ncbi:protein DpdJ [Myxococcota bacterium]
MSSETLQDELLFAIEDLEYRNLVWGDVDGSISERRILELIETSAKELGASDDPEDLLEDLLEEHAVFELPGEPPRYRSRFAETTRLLVRLRQLFPNQDWKSGLPLVSDYRLQHDRRRYPRRCIDAESALSTLGEQYNLSDLQKDLWRAATVLGGRSMDLAQFQVDAARLLLIGELSNNDTATMITTGTGSGKSLAFYLPALLRIGVRLRRDEQWVQAMVVYPRVELLKDQFAETYALARQVDHVLSQAGRRPLSIGALFSSVPSYPTEKSLRSAGWRSQGGKGWVCPLLRCTECGDHLYWRHEDFKACNHILRCLASDCSAKDVKGDHLRLTRDEVRKNPPDILFTTTEMLNQRLSDPRWRHLFGVGKQHNRKPHLALLDEVHTYSGTSGAQTGLVLRRWRHLMGAPVTWVGLSATLEEPQHFFSDLCGVDEYRVNICEPHDMVEEGAEYQLLLRADPTGMTSVLSTSIQTGMLLARMADRQQEGASRFGSRVFMFTDDLDVTNRLFDDLRDAESLDFFGRPRPNREPLAVLRDTRHGGDGENRNLYGQSWWAAREIGHHLAQPLRVARTTSADRGVDFASNVIVATAALEVGINDPAVGCVVQHKSPRTLAAYVQRKGRAGRSRSTRPMLVTVLSEFGRDRLAFQRYEHLFSPRIPAQRLPVKNQYVLRMQAVNAFLDWLSFQAEWPRKAWSWEALSAPPEVLFDSVRQRVRDAQESIHKKLIRPLLRGEGGLLVSLKEHLEKALALTPDEVDTLLWQPPRSLMLEVIPTLNRRLYSGWSVQDGRDGDLDVCVPYHPLPDFIPRTLFNELSLPEVVIELPAATKNHEEKVTTLPLLMSLRHLAPGRVTRRFAEERGGLCHWVPVETDQPRIEMPISRYADMYEHVTDAELEFDGVRKRVPVFRPWKLRLQKVTSSEAAPSSNSSLVWESRFATNGEPISLALPTRSRWRDVVHEPRFFLHRFDSSVTVGRFATMAKARILRGRNEYRVEVRFTSEDSSPAALGFEYEVDGFCVGMKLPDLSEVLSAFPAGLRSNLRSEFFRHRIQTDGELPGHISVFDREWLREMVVNGLVSRALAADGSLEKARKNLTGAELANLAREVLGVRFGAFEDATQRDDAASVECDEFSGGDEPAEVPYSTLSRRRLADRLDSHLSDPQITKRLLELSEALWAPDEASFKAWLQKVLADAFAAALLQACVESTPLQAATDSLLVDTALIPDGSVNIWVTESTMGGGGVLDSLAQAFQADPNVLPNAIEAVLAPQDAEQAASALHQVLIRLPEDETLRTRVADYRRSNDPDEREIARLDLFDHLAEIGVAIGHSIAVSMQSRLLLPGSNERLDSLLLTCLNRWEAIEAHLGIELNQREFVYLASADQDICSAVLRVSGRYGVGRAVIYSILQNLLWARGGELRARVLDHYNPYRSSQRSDPGLLRATFVEARVPTVDFVEPNWRTRFRDTIVDTGAVRLCCQRKEETTLRREMPQLLTSPIDCDFLQFYPAIERIEREVGQVSIVFVLRELL